MGVSSCQYLILIINFYLIFFTLELELSPNVDTYDKTNIGPDREQSENKQ